MATFDSLPPDQRAVLQLVLQRGRSYDQIAALLSIERAAVRQRALDALDSLTPAGNGSTTAQRALITDYLLRQLPPRVAGEVEELLAVSAEDNAWARAVARELEPLSAGLVEIPSLHEPSRMPPATAPETSLAPDTPAAPGTPLAPDTSLVPETPAAPARPALPETPPRASTSFERRPARPAGNRRSGALLLGGIVAAAVVVVVLAVTGVFSGSTASKPNAIDKAATSSTGKTTTSKNTAKYLAQINLSASAAYSKAEGVVQVVQESLDGKVYTGMVIRASGLPANTKHNAYAVWLSNPGGGSKFVGFDGKLVKKNGILKTEGELPADATSYKRILITLETSAKPKTPGTVVLSGNFTESASK